MNADIKLLRGGNCEELKLGVHGMALALAVLCGAYNTAAWLLRRERHLAVNSVMYAALTFWEVQHVLHHWAAMRVPGSPGPQVCEAPEPERFIGKCA